MKGTLTQGGKVADAALEAIQQAVAGGDFFWLDLDVHDPGPDDDVPGLLINTMHFHPVAVEAADKFGQRARIDDYEDFVHVVTFGMGADGKSVAWTRDPVDMFRFHIPVPGGTKQLAADFSLVGAYLAGNDFARTHNCWVAEQPSASGYCWKDTFADWHCGMISGAAKWKTNVLPPQGY